MESTLTQKQQPLISSFGTSNIISIGAYLFETLQWWGGYPSLSYYLEYIPNAVEYGLGDKGGKVIYVNGELTKNYEAGGLAKAFAEAILDPVIAEEDDEAELKDGLAGTDYYYDANAKPLAMTRSNLDLVLNRGGVKLNSGKVNADISFVMNVSRRKANSIASPVDPISDDEVVEQDLAVTLIMPSGDVYAIHRAIPGEGTISVGVSSADNIRTGDWKYVIDDVSGFPGDSVVIMSAVDGHYDLHLEAFNDFLAANSEDVIIPQGRARSTASSSKIMAARNFPRGLTSDTYYHRLGDDRNTLSSGAARRVAFGPLIKRQDVKVWRIDDDLVLDIAGAVDDVTVSGWFSQGRGVGATVSEVAFFDGSTLSATELNNMAVEREPDIVFTVISTESYVAGTDGNDNLVGHEGRNDIFFGGKGRDTITGNGGSNVYYYRKGDGMHSIINKKGEGETNALRFDFEISTDDVQVSRGGNDMVFTVADSGSIVVRNWYSDDVAKLDRAEFPGGIFWDVRDLEKLAAGRQLATRTLFIDSTEIDPEMALDNAINEENEEREVASSSEGGLIAKQYGEHFEGRAQAN